MVYKFLLTISLASLGSFAGLGLEAVGQERPKCYIIDNSGELTDLTDICNVSQKQSSGNNSASSDGQNIVNNNININSESAGIESSSSDRVLVLSQNSERKAGSIDSTYYLENEIGSNYTAYVRSYQAPLTSADRRTLRNRAFGFDRDASLTSVLRDDREVPFLIYRY